MISRRLRSGEQKKAEHWQWQLRLTIRIEEAEVVEHHRQEEAGELVEGVVEELQEGEVNKERFKRSVRMKAVLGVEKSITGVASVLTRRHSVRTVEREDI